MHYIVGWPKILNLQHLQTVSAENGDSSTSDSSRLSLRILRLFNLSHRSFLILTRDALSVWQNEPTVELACHVRLPPSLQRMGYNSCICVEHQNSLATRSQSEIGVAVSTSKCSILFYRISFTAPHEEGDDCERSYRESAQGSRTYANGDPACPSVRITSVRSVSIPNSVVTSLCAVGEYVFAATQNSLIHRVRWVDGRLCTELTIDLRTVNFFSDLLNSRPNRLVGDEETHVRSMQFCPLLNSVATLLSNGKGALLTSLPQRNGVPRHESGATPAGSSETRTAPTGESPPEACSVDAARELIGIWPEHLKHATCMCVNDRYRAVAFGGRATETSVYMLDEESGSLEYAYKLKLTTKDYPNAPTVCGSVVALRWSPDETLLATVWERFGFALWTVFGRLLFSTLSFVQETIGSHIDARLLPVRRPSRHNSAESNSGSDSGPPSGAGTLPEPAESHFVMQNVSTLEFDAFGYRLYVASEGYAASDLACFTLAKCAHSVSPTNAECGAHVLLHTDSQVLLHVGPYDQPTASAAHALHELPSGNRSLQPVALPPSYGQMNAPIRFVALSPRERALAVAGERGFCVYLLPERKWRLFQNEAQERDFFVWPGTFFWYSPCDTLHERVETVQSQSQPLYVGCVARTADNRADELRLYGVREKLDTRAACIVRLFAVPNESYVPASVTSSAYAAHAFDRFLVIYSRFTNSAVLYVIEDRNVYASSPGEAKRLEPIKVQEVSLTSVILQPFSVVSVYLSSLHTESLVALGANCDSERETSPERRRKPLSTYSLIRSLVVNYAGRVFLVQSHCAQAARNTSGTSKPPLKPTQPQHSYLPLVVPANAPRQMQSKYKPIQFAVPAVTLANKVETVWFDYSYRAPLNYEVIWLNGGQSGVCVWLPLIAPLAQQSVLASQLQASQQSRMNVFLSKRIMLTFQPSSNGTPGANGGFYVIALGAKDAQLVGLQCELHAYVGERALTASSPYCVWYKQVPFVSWSRSHVSYVHSIIVQLLRKNLGVYALEFAQHFAAQQPQTFEVSLELLIHELIEEEAVTKVPIPDPLLPRAVEFLREFPTCYYRTLAYVLRKTEMNLWPYVIKSIGPQTSVKDLFEQCLYLSDSPIESSSFCPLNVAACYFLVLQNLEPTAFSKQHALLLLDRALRHEQWTLSNDLVRYLKSIDPAEIDDSASTAHFTPLPSPSGTAPGSTATNAPISGASSKQNADQKAVRNDKQLQLVRRMSNAAGRSRSPPHSPPGVVPLSSVAIAGSLTEADEHHAVDSVSNQLDQTMVKHCRSLLTEYRLRKLGRFAANIPDFHLIGFLKKDAARIFVGCCVTAINQIHRDFRWPMPILLPTMDTLSLASTKVESLVASPVRDRDVPRPHSPSGSLADDASCATTLTTGSRADGASSTDSQRVALQLLGSSLSVQRGSEQSEAELRYLYHVFREADCLDFTLLICIVLRDERLLVELVDTFLLRSTSDAQSSRIARLFASLGELLDWSTEACLGYYPFLTRIDERVRSALNVPIGYHFNNLDKTMRADVTPRSRSRIASEGCPGRPETIALSRSHTVALERPPLAESHTTHDGLPKSKSESEKLASAKTSSTANGLQQDASAGYCVVS